MADLTAKVKIGAEDRFSGPAAKIGGAAGKLQKRVSAAEAELKALGRQDQTLARFGRFEKKLGASGTALDAARKRTSALRKELRATSSPTKALADAFERARDRSTKLGAAHARQRAELRGMRSDLREAGIETRNLADAQAELDRKVRAATDRAGRARGGYDEIAARRAKSAKAYERLAQAGMVARGAGDIGRTALNAFAAPVAAARSVAAAKGDLRSLGLDQQAADAIASRGRDVSLRIPDLSTESFTLAAYDIQSGIEGLSTEGVAGLTEAAAVTARATKGDVTDMTGLMATLHSVFKDALHAEMSDSEFGWAAAGQLAAAVEQFKTTGPKMQQAIESAGSKLSLSGVSMAEQFAALGLLQGKMNAGKAGTALDSFAGKAADAEGRFAESGRHVRLLDDQGNMLPLTRAMENLRAAFGADLSTAEQSDVAKAFGSEEAAEAIAALWKLGDDQAAAVAALEAAGLNGELVVRSMQERRDDNADARLKLLGNRWNSLLESSGERLVSLLEGLAPHLESMISAADDFVRNWPRVSTIAIGGGAALGALVAAAGLAAPALLSLAFAALHAKDWIGARRIAGKALKQGSPGSPAAGKPSRGMIGRIADAGKRIPGRVPALAKGGSLLAKLGPLAKGAARMGGRAVPFLPAALGAVEIAGAALDGSTPAEQRSKAVASAAGGVAGGLGGALGGAKLGALVGTAVFPGAGTAIGAALGGIAGGFAGDSLGRAMASWLHGDESGQPEQAPDAPAPPGQPDAAEGSTDARRYASVDARIAIYAQPGEDVEALARRVMDEIDRLRGEAEREAAFDA